MDQTTPTVGKLLKGTEGRDAIHFALAPMVAGMGLSPGERVGIRAGDGDASTACTPHVGIVDPFLAVDVKQGERFWLFLFPGTITSLRHAWTHPEFPNDTGEAEKVRDTAVQEAMSWLKWYAKREINPYCMTPDEALDKLLADLKNGTLQSYGLKRTENDIDRELWDRLAVIGVIVNPSNLSYSCSC
jgi:hypothetical protein